MSRLRPEGVIFMAKMPKWVSAAEVLETLELYFELQNCHLVGEKIGISGPAVLARLEPYGVIPRPRGNSGPSLKVVNDMNRIRALKQYLREKIEWEKQNPFEVREKHAVPAIELLSTVTLYFQLNSLQQVAEHMRISQSSVKRRLEGLEIILIPSGRKTSRARDFNNMGNVAEIMKRLSDQARIEMYRAQ